MEEQSSSGSAERQVAEFVKNDEVGIGKAPRNLAGLPVVLFLFESVDEFDGGEEPYALTVMLDGLDADPSCEVRLACARRDSDMAPGFWRARRLSTTRFIRSRVRRSPRAVGALFSAASFILRSGSLTAR
jgi:hypothetical protein